MLYIVNCTDDWKAREAARAIGKGPGMLLVSGETLTEAVLDAVIHRHPICFPPVDRGMVVTDLDYMLQGRVSAAGAVIEQMLEPLLRQNKKIWLFGRDHSDLLAHPAMVQLQSYVEMCTI